MSLIFRFKFIMNQNIQTGDIYLNDTKYSIKLCETLNHTTVEGFDIPNDPWSYVLGSTLSLEGLPRPNWI